MRQYKDGEYYYAPKGRFWGVWQYHDNGNGGGYGIFIKEYKSKDDAKREVYRLNNWKYNE
jgi:hypothetical protein